MVEGTPVPGVAEGEVVPTAEVPTEGAGKAVWKVDVPIAEVVEVAWKAIDLAALTVHPSIAHALTVHLSTDHA